MSSPRRFTALPLSDLELLRIRSGIGLDGRGRVTRHWGITIAVARDGQFLLLGAELAERLARRLRRAVAAAPQRADPSVAPVALVACARLLRAVRRPIRRVSGPCYAFPRKLRVRSRAHIVRSTAARLDWLRSCNPGNWLDHEWQALIDGRLGPWAMATIDRRVASICHTPCAMTEDAAECGVWTHPEFRGRGLAAAVTAAWASLLRPTGRQLFYSTAAANFASQRVAAKLGLRPVGWTWSLASRRDPRESRGHPLSRAGSHAVA